MVSTLQETVELMNSSDYKERFKAEYYQLEYRLEKLLKMMKDWDEGNLSFEPTCPKSWYHKQIKAMDEYLHILKRRAKKENVEL